MSSLVRTINFHGIGTPDAGIEAGEIPYWIDAGFFEQLIEDLSVSRPSNPICITFDDGNLSDLKIAAPLLKQYNLDARFFVLTGRLKSPGYLTLDDLRELHKMGFTIGSHGQDHVDWSKLPAPDLERETRQSKETLEDLLNIPVHEAAIPFGSYNRTVLKALKSAGYNAAWTSDGGSMDPAAFLRPRMSVRRDMILQSVRQALFNPIPPARQLRRALAMARKRYL